MKVRQPMMIALLFKEMGEALEELLHAIDALGPVGEEDLDQFREQAMERACDVLSCYRLADYDMCDGDVIWPDTKEIDDPSGQPIASPAARCNPF